MWAGGVGEASFWRSQRLPGKSEGPKGVTSSNCRRQIWPDGSSTTLLTKTEVLGGGELDVENVEGGDNYFRTWRLNLREDTKRLLHGRLKGTKNCY